MSGNTNLSDTRGGGDSATTGKTNVAAAVHDDDARSVAGSEKSTCSSRSGIPKLSFKPASYQQQPPLKVGRPCGGQTKAPLPPTTPLKNTSSYDYVKRVTEDLNRHKLTDVQETEEYEEDFFGRRLHLLPQHRNRYNSNFRNYYDFFDELDFFGNPLHMYPPRISRFATLDTSSFDTFRKKAEDFFSEPFYIPRYTRLSSIGSTGTTSSMDALWETHPRRLSEAGLSRHSDSSAILTEDTDSFIIGQRVWVGGTKPGQIVYIGETQFAPGEWAGIVLDQPIGKNDGSVGGVKYFQCEPKRGVFSRLTRLTRYPLGDATDSGATSPTNGNRKSPMSPISNKSALSLSNTSLASTHVDFKLGDRVIIMSGQGSKIGTLRYIGFTSFANGEWCGVELDEPRGKNDGSVQGRRYFECMPNYGIFAPVGKVSRSPSSRKPGNCVLHSGMRKGNSRESLLSMNSSLASASTAARRVRLGVTSLTPKRTPQKPPSSTPLPPRTAMQDILKEKQDHIEQLIKERDLEREEIIKAATQAEEAEQKYSTLKNEYEQCRFNFDLKLKKQIKLLENLKSEHEEILGQLEDEKRKNEDLQFKFEEAAILKGDMELDKEVKKAENEIKEAKLRELKMQLEHTTLQLDADSIQLSLVKEDLSRSLEENASLKVQLEHATEKRENLETEEGKSIELVQSLQTKLDETNKILKQQEEDYSKQIESLNTHITKLVSEHEVATFKYAKEIEDANLKHESYSQSKLEEITTLKEEIQSNQKSLEQVQKEYEKYKFESGTNDVSLKKELDKLKAEFAAELDKRQSSIDAKLKEIDDLTTVKNSLELKLKEVQDGFKATNEAGSVLQNELTNLTEAIDVKDKEIESLKGVLNKLEAENKTLCTDQNNDKQKYLELESNLKKINSDLENKQKDLTELEDVNKKLENELQVKLEDAKKLNATIEEKNIKINEGLKILDESKIFIGKLELQVGDFERKNKQLEIKLEELSNEKLKVESELQKMYGSSGEESAKLEALHTDLRDKCSEIVKLKDEYASKLENLEHTLQETKISLQQSNEKSETEIPQLVNTISNLESNNLEIKNTLQSNITEKEEIKTKLGDEIANLKQEISNKDKNLEEVKNILHEAKCSLEDLTIRARTKVEELRAESQSKVESLNKEISLHKENLTKKEETATKLCDEIANLKQEISNRDENLNQLQNTLLETQSLSKYDSEVSQAEIESLNKEISNYKDNLAKATEEADNYKQALELTGSQSSKAVDDFKNEIEKLKEESLTEAETLRKEISNYKDNLIKATEEIENYKQALELTGSQSGIALEEIKSKYEIVNANLNKELEIIKESTEKLKLELQSAVNENQICDAKIISLEEISSKQMNELQEISLKLGNIVQENQVLLENKTQSETKILEIVENNKHKDEIIQQLRTQLDSTKNDVNSNIVSIESKEKEVAQLILDLKNTQDKLQTETLVNESLLQKQSDLLKQIDETAQNYKKVAYDKETIDKERTNCLKLLHLLRISEEQKTDIITRLRDQELLILAHELKIGDDSEDKQVIGELQSKLRLAHDALNRTNDVSEVRQQEVTRLQNEMSKIREQGKTLKDNGKKLEKKDSIINNNSVSNDYKQLLEEKIFVENQVQFLNSIIVDMQKKNEEQKARIEILECGYSPAAADDLRQMGGLMEKKVAPRLYCDICEEFDLHDTEDCPLQAGDDMPAPPRNEDKKEKAPPRPYCDICEEFGHLTENCQEDQTF